ncbi:MAG: segregation/condensation protein A [Cyclobacteriaceae bacterium]|nr:segregation/condensation protein A [Cyclobacteriaceae bacterium]
MSFEIKLPLFEGPFDLLLFFIERDELDIYDIPIAIITHDFLTYIRQLEELNIEVASEFIVIAATLMRIKARLLLPRPTFDEEGNEIDPRDELVRHLLEYKKYKSVVEEFQSLEEQHIVKEKRGNVVREIRKLSELTNTESELQDVDLYKLLKAFEKAMDRYITESNKPSHMVVQFPYTIEEQKEYILGELRRKEKISFREIIQNNPLKIAIIFNFLAILEILQTRQIRISIGEGYNNFWLRYNKKHVAS